MIQRFTLTKEQFGHTAIALSTSGLQPGRAVEQRDMLADGVNSNQPSALILRHASVEKPRDNGSVQRNLNTADRAFGKKARIVVAVGALHDHGKKTPGQMGCN